MKRIVEKKVGDQWIEVEFEDLKKGDIFRMFDDDEGKREICKTKKGETEFVADSDPKEIGVLCPDCIAEIQGRPRLTEKNLTYTLPPFNADDITIDNFEGVRHYIERPVVIHALQLNFPEGFKITVAGRIIYGKQGDYLIFGDNGEKYMCPKEVFENMYDPVDTKPGEPDKQSFEKNKIKRKGGRK